MYTVNELLDRFEKERLPKLTPRSQRDYRLHIKVLRGHFGSKLAGDLKPRDIEGFRDLTPDGRIHRDRMVSVLRVTFSHAVKRGWLESNVCSRVDRIPSPERSRLLTDEEFEGAKKRAKPPIRLVMELALHTGQLPHAILAMRWSQVHEDRATILFRNARTKRKVEVPITPKLAAVLEECRKRFGRKEYVVLSKFGHPYTPEGFRSNFQRLMIEWSLTGNDRFDFYDIQKKWKLDTEQSANRRDLQSVVEEYPQFPASVRDEAAEMSVHYEFFYIG